MQRPLTVTNAVSGNDEQAFNALIEQYFEGWLDALANCVGASAQDNLWHILLNLF
jgi:hypothetical protein